MNIRKGILKFKNFRVLLGSGCGSMTLMGRLIRGISPKVYDVMQWHTKSVIIATNIKV